MFFCDFFMTDRQPFNIHERLIAYVWVNERRRRIPDSTNLHVMSEGYQTYGLVVADMCLFTQYFPNLVVPSQCSILSWIPYISGRSFKILICGINKVHISEHNSRVLTSATCRLLLQGYSVLSCIRALISVGFPFRFTTCIEPVRDISPLNSSELAAVCAAYHNEKQSLLLLCHTCDSFDPSVE